MRNVEMEFTKPNKAHGALICAVTLPLPPLVNDRYRRTRAGGVTLTEKTRIFQQAAFVLARNAMNGLDPVSVGVYVEADLYRSADRGDADGYLKALFDALNNAIYCDDSQVQAFAVQKLIDRKNPRTEVRVYVHHR